MAGTKPSIPKGTRDFSPMEMVRRQFIFDVIRDTFSLFGYNPVETPAMENLSTLLGKYGDEGDKLIFRILNSGDVISKIDNRDLRKFKQADFSGMISEKGLRYDLTVPFARYVVQHREEISFPFKRYQIQPVWRADRPQKGRYREFYQCDADIIGSDSLLNEAELIKIIDIVFNKLKIPVIIKFNNRKILSGIAETLGESEKLTDITVAIDKLDKVGKQIVISELSEKGIKSSSIKKLIPLLQLKTAGMEKLKYLAEFLDNSITGTKGIEELKILFNLTSSFNLMNDLDFDISLARGLNYYTGAIIEVKARDIAFGSLCGGGRYDDLTGIFGLPGVSGVGISFGADRIYDVLEQLALFPEKTRTRTKVLFINFGNDLLGSVIPVAVALREESINSEIYPDPVKIKRQMSYAHDNSIPFVALIGEEEISKDLITLRNMSTGEQEMLTLGQLILKLKSAGSE
jgi:histidyl-tRNA synthetase